MSDFEKKIDNHFGNVNNKLSGVSDSLKGMSGDMKSIKNTNSMLLDNSIAQTQQLQQLQNQMGLANDIQRQMFQNQINETQQKERQARLKKILFGIGKIIKKVDQIQETDMKAFLMDRYKMQLEGFLELAEEELTEINDKKEASELQDKLNTMNNSIDNNKYLESPLGKEVKVLIEYEDDYNKLKSQIPYEPRLPIIAKPKSSIARKIFGLFFIIIGSMGSCMGLTSLLYTPKNAPIMIVGSLIYLIPGILLLKSYKGGKYKKNMEDYNNAMDQYKKDVESYNSIRNEMAPQIENHPFENKMNEFNDKYPQILAFDNEVDKVLGIA
ncbi:MAG: hypothetical protein KA885_02060 [Spirochaetes bacterium]|nr:hypothetical protein [Spirochaetota bacterium]